MSSYWCCIYTRDGADTLLETLRSLISQTITPAYIVVVDDNSTDATPDILRSVSNIFPALHIVNTNSKTRDIRRAPWLLNLALEAAAKLPETTYMMISGDDCIYPPDYAATIMRRMDAEENLAVASGDWGMPTTLVFEKLPKGAGRLIRTSFMTRLGGRYPVAYGWEAWLLLKALQLGWQVRNYEDIRYQHLRPYRPRNVYSWGKGMYSLGYPSYFVLLRFSRNLLLPKKELMMNRQVAVSMLSGYVAAMLNRSGEMMIQDRGLHRYVKRRCASRVIRPITR